MAQGNEQVVRAVYDAWRRGELPGPPQLLDDTIDYVNPPAAIEPGTRRGLAAFTEAVERVFEGCEFWRMEREHRALDLCGLGGRCSSI